MKKHKDGLFRIGEVAKILGVTRKALLVYEEAGLLTPAVKDEESGFRYYSADNMTQISSIRGLQTLGLSLKEVSEYYSNARNMDLHLQRLLELRGTLDNNIQMLQVRSAKQGDLTIRRAFLPRQTCFCRQYLYGTVADASNHLRDTYIAAARTGMMAGSGKMFTLRLPQNSGALEFRCCIPVHDSFDGPERMDFAATDALCIYYRGPYEGTGTAIRALEEYVQKHNFQTTGPFRSIYLEGPPNRGANSADYITQVAVPIASLP